MVEAKLEEVIHSGSGKVKVTFFRGFSVRGARVWIVLSCTPRFSMTGGLFSARRLLKVSIFLALDERNPNLSKVEEDFRAGFMRLKEPDNNRATTKCRESRMLDISKANGTFLAIYRSLARLTSCRKKGQIRTLCVVRIMTTRSWSLGLLLIVYCRLDGLRESG